MTNEIRMTKAKNLNEDCFGLRASSLIRHSSFVIRASSFLSRSSHSRHFRKAEDASNDVFTRRIFDLIDRNSVRDVESTGLRAAEGVKMGAAAKPLADIVDVGAHIKPFTTHDAEIDFGRSDTIDRVAVNMNKTRLAFDYFPLTRQLIKRHATVLFGRDHR